MVWQQHEHKKIRKQQSQDDGSPTNYTPGMTAGIKGDLVVGKQPDMLPELCSALMCNRRQAVYTYVVLIIPTSKNPFGTALIAVLESQMDRT